MSATDLLVWGVVAHALADWLLQNEWIAENKVSLGHPAAWVHGGIHYGCLAFVFPFSWAAGIALIHMAIDTRGPRQRWANLIGQTTKGEMGTHVALWVDQVMHMSVIAVAARLAS